MSENRSSLVRAVLALSMMLLVVAFIIFKSGAVEKRSVTKMVNGKAQESQSYGFNAAKIPVYLKSFVAPITGNQALVDEK